MKAIYTDLHIHTSESADALNLNYDVELLCNNIEAFSKTNNYLISLTDHNIINKNAYEKLLGLNRPNIILGVELHIRNYENVDPYHCHMYFNIDECDILNSIDNINCILDSLYPKKMVSKEDKIPRIEQIIQKFEEYDFLLLPHGGQSHSTFNRSLEHGKRLDSVIERNIYHNQIDGFTSRSNKGIDKTIRYFENLGISDFVNLITCSDNYNPKKYPNTKSGSEPFVPTWMISMPNFSGLRLALSESTRLFYQLDEPRFTNDYIKNVSLHNDLCDINVCLTPGLNVIIGGSSSGKTLLMDSLYKKITDGFADMEQNQYKKFKVDEICVDYPAGSVPHYINQNYIINIINDQTGEGVGSIDIIRNAFLNEKSFEKQADKQLLKLKEVVKKLFDCSNDIYDLQGKIRSINHFPRLITKVKLQDNYFEKIIPSKQIQQLIKINDVRIQEYEEMLIDLETLAINNPFMSNVVKELEVLKNAINDLKKKVNLSDNVISIIQKYKQSFSKKLKEKNQEAILKKEQKENLIKYIAEYKEINDEFYKAVNEILEFSFEYQTSPIENNGHKLYIESDFKLNSSIILEAINSVLNQKYRIKTLDDLTPDSLFEIGINSKKIKDRKYINDVYETIAKTNKKKYKIITKDGKDFDELSPGWKTAIILDLVLKHDNDVAPIFIDQPEDNLATNYINKDLVDAIKNSKRNKQIIIISHNATIPMMADAQNIILCENLDGKIRISSAAMEDKIFGKSVIDSIADITDGGKSSIKKRVKKYNLKSFKEKTDESNG